MRTLLLALLYFAVITPIGSLCRVLGHPFPMAPDPKAATYWDFIDSTSGGS